MAFEDSVKWIPETPPGYLRTCQRPPHARVGPRCSEPSGVELALLFDRRWTSWAPTTCTSLTVSSARRPSSGSRQALVPWATPSPRALGATARLRALARCRRSPAAGASSSRPTAAPCASARQPPLPPPLPPLAHVPEAFRSTEVPAENIDIAWVGFSASSPCPIPPDHHFPPPPA
jgi:hypothetical protein